MSSRLGLVLLGLNTLVLLSFRPSGVESTCIINGAKVCCSKYGPRCRSYQRASLDVYSPHRNTIEKCFCDERCTLYRDCCRDYEAVCPRPEMIQPQSPLRHRPQDQPLRRPVPQPQSFRVHPGSQRVSFSQFANQQGRRSSRQARTLFERTPLKFAPAYNLKSIAPATPQLVRTCQVSEWGPWSHCSKTCGGGWTMRQRRVIALPQGDGVDDTCPTLVQSGTCAPSKCRLTRRYTTTNRYEKASLLPADDRLIRSTRLYNPKYDIRRNLYYSKLERANKTDLNLGSTCAMYELVSTNCRNPTFSSSFKQNIWRSRIQSLDRIGNTICVTCLGYQREKSSTRTCKGVGSMEYTSRFDAKDVGRCSGTFRLIMKPRYCFCPTHGYNAYKSFIFST